MELDGAVKIGDTETTEPDPGTLRYNPDSGDFEGWNGQWRSLTAASGAVGSGTAFDIDGNQYLTVVLGTQTWMRENLKTTRYRNGDPIEEVLLKGEWEVLDTGAWSWYDHDSEKDVPFGKLYNWFAVNDGRGLCPTGWHVPTGSEWTTLTDYLGGTTVAGGKLKKTGSLTDGTGYWSNTNDGVSNESGFSGVPSGFREADGDFGGLSSSCVLWSSTEFDISNALIRLILSGGSAINASMNDKRFGFAVRCVKN